LADSRMVVVEKLVKVYPGGIRAVAGIDFTVDQGEFVGFLGPNGAGKSTTMKVLSTLLKKTSGRVVVAGHDVDRDSMEVRKSIGFAMQEVGLDDLSSGWDFLVTQGLLYGLSRKEARRRAGELLALALGVSFKGGALGIVVVVLLTTAFGIAWSCLGLMIALKTKSAQATQSSFVLFIPFIFLTTAFMPKEVLPGWFKIAVAINPVTYVLESLRTIVIEGWEWGTILTGVWVLGVMLGVLMVATTWLYRRATA